MLWQENRASECCYESLEPRQSTGRVVGSIDCSQLPSVTDAGEGIDFAVPSESSRSPTSPFRVSCARETSVPPHGFGERARCDAVPFHLLSWLVFFMKCKPADPIDFVGRDRTYLGGKLVFGMGSSCPHDFRFLGGFFSSVFASCTLVSGAFNDVSAGETVSSGIAGAGVPDKDSTTEVKLSSIL
jgi:hypothetical protein